MTRGYIVVHQQPELDVVVGRHGDLADGDEEEDALRVSHWVHRHLAQAQDIGVGVRLHAHHQQVDQVLVGQLLRLTRSFQPHGDQRSVLVVVAVLVEQVRQQHAQQVARLRVGCTVASDHRVRRLSREQQNHRWNHVQMRQEANVTQQHRRPDLRVRRRTSGHVVAAVDVVGLVVRLVRVLVHDGRFGVCLDGLALLGVAEQQHEDVVHGPVLGDGGEHLADLG